MWVLSQFVSFLSRVEAFPVYVGFRSVSHASRVCNYYQKNESDTKSLCDYQELGVQFVDFRHCNLMTPKFMSYIQTCVSNGFWNVKEAFETTYEQT